MRDGQGSRSKDDEVIRRHENEVVGLCREARRGGVTRRQFIERALVLGLSASTVGALASACGGGETAESGASPKPMDTTQPDKIVFYNWTDYLAPGLIKAFKKETGITVSESYFTENEEMLAKLRAGATGYDVIVPSDWTVTVMRKSGLLEPLDMSYIPNFQYVGKQFQAPIYDDPTQQDGKKYSVPYFYGSTGYVRRTDKVPQEMTDWTPLFDPANKGKIDMLNNERETIGVGLFILGYDPNTKVQSELDAATQKLIEQKPLVTTYDSINQKRAIAQGQPLVHCWDGDALMAIDVLGGDTRAKKLVAFVRPTEGFFEWVDNLVCPVGCNSRYGAHLWMNYLLDPKVAGKNASWVWYLSAVAPASWEYTDPFALSLKPTDEELSRSHVTLDLGEFQRNYDEAWRRIKSA